MTHYNFSCRLLTGERQWRIQLMLMICGKYFTTSLARLYMTVRKSPYCALCTYRDIWELFSRVRNGAGRYGHRNRLKKTNVAEIAAKKLNAAIRQYRSREESTLFSKSVSGFYRHISSQLKSHDDNHTVLTGSDGQELTKSTVATYVMHLLVSLLWIILLLRQSTLPYRQLSTLLLNWYFSYCAVECCAENTKYRCKSWWHSSQSL